MKETKYIKETILTPTEYRNQCNEMNAFHFTSKSNLNRKFNYLIVVN